jgi:glycosyltransferase involved in cell wall biosynthesis
MSRLALPSQLHVCLVARSFPAWGRATTHSFLWLIARGLAQHGHSVTVLSSENPLGKNFVEQDGVKIYFLNEGRHLRSQSAFMDLVKNKFVELHKERPFHLLHSVDAAARRISRFKKHYGLAVAYDVEATQMSQLFAILGMAQATLGSQLATGLAVAYKFLRTFYGGDRRLLKTADGVFVSSPQQRIVLERYYLYPDARIYSVPYGIEIGDLEPREKSDELRKQLNIPESAKTVVTISDMTDVAELKNLLLAFEAVVIRKPSSRLIIIGNGPKFKDIEYQILNLALGNKVIFTGAVKTTDLPDYIALSDVFVNLSSRTTGFEPSLLEAMAQKKVIIGSEVSPMATIVENGHDGFLVRPADVSELTSLLMDIFAGQLSILEIGEQARQKVINLFDTEKMVKETINAYYAILRSTGYYRKK